jgi:hypothetical protein
VIAVNVAIVGHRGAYMALGLTQKGYSMAKPDFRVVESLTSLTGGK